jgi:signal transduction histidine kinase
MHKSSVIAAASAQEMATHDPATVVRHLSQELRQPLSSIESIAHYLNMVLPRADTKARRQLERLHEEVRQVRWVLSDAIYFFQAFPPNLHLTDLTEIIARDLSEWSPAEGAGLSFTLQPDLPLVNLDLEQTQHMLRNVVEFFRRSSAPGRSIHLETYASGGDVMLKIASGSLEYSAEDIEPLLEPFSEGFPAGSGLALACARRIAEAQGGHVEATPEPPNSLTLVISFPAA